MSVPERRATYHRNLGHEPTLGEAGEVFLEKFQWSALQATGSIILVPEQIYATNLAGNGFGEV
jgi:hypothetical protein